MVNIKKICSIACLISATSIVNAEIVEDIYNQESAVQEQSQKDREMAELKKNIMSDIKMVSDSVVFNNFSISSKSGGVNIDVDEVKVNNYQYPQVADKSSIVISGLNVAGEDVKTGETFGYNFESAVLSYSFLEDSFINLSLKDENLLDLSLNVNGMGLDKIKDDIEQINRNNMLGVSKEETKKSLMTLFAKFQQNVKLKGGSISIVDKGFVKKAFQEKAKNIGSTYEEVKNMEIEKIKASPKMNERVKNALVSFINGEKDLDIELTLKTPMGFMDLMMFNVLTQNNPEMRSEQFKYIVK